MANEERHMENSISEEAAALGKRVKGAAKDAAGAVSGNPELEREGERENAEGRRHQAQNDALGTSRSTDTEWSNRNLVTGLYDPDSANRAYGDLTTRHGYTPDDVSVVMSDDTRKQYFDKSAAPGQMDASEGSKAAEGAGIGAGVGMGVGATIGALVATATAIAIPGVGLIVAGPIAGAIAGAGAGGATGTILGALVGAGIPEDRAAQYEQGVKEGGIVLGTRARDEAHAAELEHEFAHYGARDIRR